MNVNDLPSVTYADIPTPYEWLLSASIIGLALMLIVPLCLFAIRRFSKRCANLPTRVIAAVTLTLAVPTAAAAAIATYGSLMTGPDRVYQARQETSAAQSEALSKFINETYGLPVDIDLHKPWGADDRLDFDVNDQSYQLSANTSGELRVLINPEEAPRLDKKH